MKFKIAWWVFVATVAAAFSTGADPVAPPAAASTNQSSTVSTNGTNAVVEAKVPGDIYTNSIGMVLIKAGSFWAGKYEVTQKEYQKITGANPSAFVGETRPVDSVSWNDAVEFCDKLSALDVESNSVPKDFYYTLPTEDEWQSLVGGATLDNAVTSQNGAARQSSSPVGSLGPNGLGLYDVRGNVMEFCLGDTDKPYRVLHGASWQDSVEVNLRPEFRYYCKPDETKNTFGFRCVLKQK